VFVVGENFINRMNIGCFKSLGRWKRATIFCQVAVVVAVLGAYQQCQGQALQSSSSSALSSDSLSQINWQSGPAKANLAECADIDVPIGYRLTGAPGARLFLQSLNNPVPKNLIGLLTTDSGKWWAVVEYEPNGYVKDADVQHIDASAVLKSLQAQTQNGAVTSLNWQSQPAYDSQAHSLAWSLQVHAGSMQAMNETVVLLGRRGVFQITAFHPDSMTDAPSLTQLAGNIAFRDGERYADYQTGDKIADAGLTDLIVGSKSQPVKVASTGFGGAAAAWIYSGMALVILGGGAFFLKKKKSHRSSRVSHSSHSSHAAAPAPVMANGNGAAQKPAVVMSNGHHNGNGNGMASHGSNGSNGNGASRKQFHRHRRKKAFDYPKFYTHVMRELSLHSYGPATAPANGKSRANGHANGHQNGATNGHTNGHTNGNGSNGNGASVNDSIKTEIVELIATQKNLINEQKCLLEQQTKLIEEKRWLIEEQTAFLKGQSEQQFPLKFE
jgi:uncharacterized membrane-anchored protein